MTVRNDPRPWERGCQYPRHADEMNAALDRQRQEITAEIEAAHLEREMKLAADLDAAKAEISALKDYRQAAEDRLDNLRKYVNSVVEEYEELVTYLRCAEEQRDSAMKIIDEVKGVVGFPGTAALRKYNLTESLPDVVRYCHREWLTQTHASQQRLIDAETRVDRVSATIRDLTAEVERMKKRKAVRCSACDAAGAICIAPGDGASVCRICHGTGAVIVDGDSGREGK